MGEGPPAGSLDLGIYIGGEPPQSSFFLGVFLFCFFSSLDLRNKEILRDGTDMKISQEGGSPFLLPDTIPTLCCPRYRRLDL